MTRPFITERYPREGDGYIAQISVSVLLAAMVIEVHGAEFERAEHRSISFSIGERRVLICLCLALSIELYAFPLEKWFNFVLLLY